MAVKQLTEATFEQVIKESPVPVIVDFYADWCQPCKRIAPLLEEIADEKGEQVLVCKVNVDENRALAASFEIMNIPYVISFKKGERHKHVIGVVPKEDLLDLIV